MLALLAATLLAAPSSYVPEAVPRVSVFPRSIRVGGGGALEVQVEMPARGGKPRVWAFVGHVEPPALEEGVWIAHYRPPADVKGPSYDVIVAESPVTGATAAIVVDLVVRTRIPIAVSKAVSEVKVEVAGREFGPVGAGMASTIDVEVEVPPGVKLVKVTASVPGLAPQVSDEELALPPLRRVFVQAPPIAPIGKPFEVKVVALDRKGALWLDEPSLDLKGAGSLKRVSAIGPGVWKAEIVPAGGALTINVKGAGAKWRSVVPVPPAPRRKGTPTPTPTPTPAAVTLLPEDPPFPPAPTCEELKVVPGEVTTSSKLRERIDVALREGDLVERRDRLIRIMCMFPDEKVVRLQLAASWLLLGANEIAIEELQPLLTDEAEVHEEHRALGLSYAASAKLRMGDLDGAIADARAAESLMPGLYSATYVLGEAYYVKKDFPNALAALLSAYRAAPGFASALDHEILAQLLEARGTPGEAVLHRMAAARLEPNRLEQWKTAARVAESAGHWARAHEAWQAIASSSLPGLADSGAALSAAARAAIAAPKDREIQHLEAALLAERKSDLKRAISHADQVVVANKLNVAARYHLARLLAAAGNDDRASQEVSRVLDAAPKWAPALLLAGDLDRKRGDMERAQIRYQEAESLGAPLSMVAKWRLAELNQ